jgi:hypothetical protein
MSNQNRAKLVNQKQLSLSKSRDPNKNYQYKPLKKTLEDNIYYLGSAKQAADYESTTEFLFNHIKKTFNFGGDIGTVLETLEELRFESVQTIIEYYLKC